MEKCSLAKPMASWLLHSPAAPVTDTAANDMAAVVASIAAPYDCDLELAVIDHAGEHALIFPCRRAGTNTWIDALTGRRIKVQPTHWCEWSKNQRSRLH